jgi:S-adenosylmethionine:tRNA ribosyltransferase-isomerase
MLVDLFDFDLPAESIALRPAEPRDNARMLVFPASGGRPQDRRVRDLPSLLRPGDALAVNDARVIRARLRGYRFRAGSKAQIEATLIEQRSSNSWRAMARPAKKLAPGDRLSFGAPSESGLWALPPLEAEVETRGVDGEVTLTFDRSGPALSHAIEACGSVPLPPYIASKRSPDRRDDGDYQTLFAANPGAVAAPTAGLHFTQELLHAVEAAGISLHRLTLQVGAGTFLPVRAQDTRDHVMHAEHCSLSKDTAERLNEVKDRGGRIVAVGTTALRCLESAANSRGRLEGFCAKTDIFIVPGYRFRVVDVLMTNFHLPRSTLFMLVCAFGGLDRLKAGYAQAVRSGYRFYSYGDATLLFRT